MTEWADGNILHGHHARYIMQLLDAHDAKNGHSIHSPGLNQDAQTGVND